MTISAGPRSPRTATSAKYTAAARSPRERKRDQACRARWEPRSGQPSPTSVSSSIAMNAAAAKMTAARRTVASETRDRSRPRRPRSARCPPTRTSSAAGASPASSPTRTRPSRSAEVRTSRAGRRWSAERSAPPAPTASAAAIGTTSNRPANPSRGCTAANDQLIAGSARMPEADGRGMGWWRVTRTAVVTKTTRPSTTIAASAGVSDHSPMSPVKPGSPMLRLIT